MTVEERLDRIEQLHGEHMELAKQDRIAYIAWKRDMESQVQATWLAIECTSKGIEQMASENKAGFAEMRTDFKERDRLLDERIHKLVTAIGELIQRLDKK